MQPARRHATYDDVLNAPDTMVAEIIDGDLYTSPRPASPHALASSAIGSDLHGPFNRRTGAGGPGGWWILDEPELHMGPDVLVPDLAGWRRERMPRLPNAAYFTLTPDWVCEIVSPRSGGLDRVRKMRIYGREGVGHSWIVEPLQKTLEIYRLESSRWLVVSTHSDSEVVRAEPFDAIELQLSRWWIEPE